MIQFMQIQPTLNTIF